jgi:hypothetical protein
VSITRYIPQPVKRRLRPIKREWCICPSVLPRPSVVYSSGVGLDISFDRALAAGSLFGHLDVQHS